MTHYLIETVHNRDDGTSKACYDDLLNIERLISMMYIEIKRSIFMRDYLIQTERWEYLIQTERTINMHEGM